MCSDKLGKLCENDASGKCACKVHLEYFRESIRREINHTATTVMNMDSDKIISSEWHSRERHLFTCPACGDEIAIGFVIHRQGD